MEPVILLVEDSHFDVELLQHAFRKAGLGRPLEVVRDGVEAMSYLLGVGEYADRDQYPSPNILLIDLNMPRFNGLELLTWLRTQPDLQHLLVVILTGTGRQADIDIAYAWGPNPIWLSRPRPTNFNPLLILFTAF